MAGNRSSLPPRGLLALIAAVTLIPLGTLLWLGWQLVQQDRALEAQQAQQRLDRSADLVVGALERSVAAWEQRMASDSDAPPAGAVNLTIRGGDTFVAPRTRVAFLPAAPLLPEPPASAFAAGDDAEYRARDLSAAGAIFLALTRSPHHATRTGALLRLGRLQQNAGQTDAALATFHAVLAVDDVGISGVPAGLIARFARCRVFEALGRREELFAEATALLSDLQASRWPLTAAVYWLYVSDARRWTGATSPGAREEERLAAAVAAFYERARPPESAEGRASGREVLGTGDDSITVLWQSTPDSTTALLATRAFTERHLFAGVDDVARDQNVVLTAETRSAGLQSSRSAAAIRTAAQTGLPWTISVTPVDPEARQTEFVVRRRLLVAGFLLLVTMAVVASYFIIRAVSRELAVARLQSDFVAAVSHDFRTPLTTLRQFTDMLRENATLSDERRRICYEAQSRATDRLTRLVESLLDFGRMEADAKPYHYESHDLSTLVSTIVDDFRVDAAAAGYDVRFRGNGAAPVLVDKDAFSRAVWNLLDNAVKYSPGADGIDVDVHRHNGDAIVAIHDRGLGIPTDERAAIFTKFHRGAEARRPQRHPCSNEISGMMRRLSWVSLGLGRCTTTSIRPRCRRLQSPMSLGIARRRMNPSG